MNSPSPLPSPPASSVVSLFDSDKVAVVFFFKPSTLYGQQVQALQACLGFKDGPCHVGLYYQGRLIEVTTSGTTSRPVAMAAVQKICSSFYVVHLGDDEVDELNAQLEAALSYDWYFDLGAAVWFCFRMLVLNRGRKPRLAPTNFGSVAKVAFTRTTEYTPPLSCTTLVWNVLDLPSDWRVFAPAALEKALVENK